MRLSNGTVRKYRRSFNEIGHAHELTFSCYGGQPMLNRDRTRQWMVEAIDAARRRHHFEVWAYVIMPEHAHALILPGGHYEMSTILKTIKQSVARKALAFLRKHEPAWMEKLRARADVGGAIYHFWQPGGGYDRNITKAATAWASVEYLHRNPVRRGLAACETDWKWSSARWYAGLDGVVLPMDDRPPDS
ncbi:MAG: hypothetical protein HOP29_05005 [Phycisphaerales bacterium]|nr:hypothetical protein [Phycisphaerales bacterium]